MRLISPFSTSISSRLLAAGIACFSIVPALADTPAHPGHQNSGRWQDASLDDYRRHLLALSDLTEACAKARDLKTCDPTLVGPDDRVPVSNNSGAERRIVRYGWLRILFSRAEEPDSAPQASTTVRKPTAASPKESFRPAPSPVSQLLQDASARLAHDLAHANGAPISASRHTLERDTLRQVLSGREFQDLHTVDASDTALERFGNWLNHFLESAGRLRARSAWVGRALVWGFLLMVGLGLAWALVRLERRWRIRLVHEADNPPTEAISARDWQLWLADARQAAAAGHWREAVHFIYWSAISRLESKRLWPADRTRTPREYLALVAPEDPRRPALDSLTTSFERIWYGGRAAQERDYRQAEELAVSLFSGGRVHAAESAEGGPR